MWERCPSRNRRTGHVSRRRDAAGRNSFFKSLEKVCPLHPPPIVTLCRGTGVFVKFTGFYSCSQYRWLVLVPDAAPF